MKKLLSVLMAALLVFGMSASAFAAGEKINGYNNGAILINNNLSTLSPQDCKKEIAIAYFEKNSFAWVDNIPKNGNLTMSDLNSGKVKLRTVIKSGKKAISGVRLAIDKNSSNGTASTSRNKPAILLTLNSSFASLKELDFEVIAYVYVQGQGSQTDYPITITGTLANPEDEAEKGDTYGDMRDGHIIKFNATCRDYEFELLDTMSIWGTGVNKKQYWAYASTDMTEQDEKIVEKYPSIIECITLSTLGFNSDLFKVKFRDLEPETQYVYTLNASGQLAFLGKSNVEMPLLTKYYLSEKEIKGIKKYTAPKAATSSSSSKATSSKAASSSSKAKG